MHEAIKPFGKEWWSGLVRRMLSTRFLVIVGAFGVLAYTLHQTYFLTQFDKKADYDLARLIAQLAFGLFAWYIGNRTYQHKKEIDANGKGNGD